MHSESPKKGKWKKTQPLAKNFLHERKRLSLSELLRPHALEEGTSGEKNPLIFVVGK